MDLKYYVYAFIAVFSLIVILIVRYGWVVKEFSMGFLGNSLKLTKGKRKIKTGINARCHAECYRFADMKLLKKKSMELVDTIHKAQEDKIATSLRYAKNEINHIKNEFKNSIRNLLTNRGGDLQSTSNAYKSLRNVLTCAKYKIFEEIEICFDINGFPEDIAEWIETRDEHISRIVDLFSIEVSDRYPECPALSHKELMLYINDNFLGVLRKTLVKIFDRARKEANIFKNKEIKEAQKFQKYYTSMINRRDI